MATTQVRGRQREKRSERLCERKVILRVLQKQPESISVLQSYLNLILWLPASIIFDYTTRLEKKREREKGSERERAGAGANEGEGGGAKRTRESKREKMTEGETERDNERMRMA